MEAKKQVTKASKVCGTNSKRPKKGERNYYENFDFFFKRTTFRTMTLYFKLAFKPFFDKSKGAKK